MDSSWTKSLAWVRESEGGNDDDPHDPGGRTSRGITQREYNAYCEMAGLSQGDVWKATDPVVDDIYHRSYWMPYCPVLPAGPDYIFFDESVNAGLHEAVLILQRALGVGADGHIGVITSAAIAKTDPAKLVDEMSAQRVAVYKSIEAGNPTLHRYDKGWMSRVAFAQKNAHTLIVPAAS